MRIARNLNQLQRNRNKKEFIELSLKKFGPELGNPVPSLSPPHYSCLL
jgi:hypothetical protein